MPSSIFGTIYEYFQLPVQHRKQKTRIALLIRIFGVCSILGVYSILAFSLGEGPRNIPGKFQYRHILNAIPEDVESDTNGMSEVSSTDFSALTNSWLDSSIITDSHSESNRIISQIESSESFPRRNCTKAAILEFPSDGLTKYQRQHGWILIHLVLACYCFWLLAVVCDDYFVPAIDVICSSLKMKEDVVGATFMAAATSSPELFINCVGTFITKGDIGVGTVVGSAVFNILAVPACCGLLAGQVVNLDWWPLSRDCLIYGMAVLSLIGVLYDGKVMWYEAFSLVLAYFLYIFAMYCNDIMAKKVKIMVATMKRKTRSSVKPYREVGEITPLLSNKNGLEENNQNLCPRDLETITEVNETGADTPWKKTDDTKLLSYVIRWPIIFILWCTIPDCKRCPKLGAITFLMSIFWIGIISYAVAYLITIFGDTINIPDSVMGLTFLAAGTSVPEAVSSVIVTNQGHGAMGISNSIGSNTFDILLCLGLPWLIKAYFLPANDGEHWVSLNSTGFTYSAVSLLSTLIGLYVAFSFNKFRLDWKIGLTCTIMYITFLIFASMMELNVFFDVNMPICDH